MTNSDEMVFGFPEFAATVFAAHGPELRLAYLCCCGCGDANDANDANEATRANVANAAGAARDAISRTFMSPLPLHR